MPDLERDLAALREQVGEQVQPPPVDRVIERACRRTSRRRVQLLTAVVVVLVAAAVPLLRLGVQRDTAGPPGAGNFVVSVDFFSYTRGYALGGWCPSETSCTPWMLATTDGQTWEKRAAPPELEIGPLSTTERIIALATDGVVIEDGPKRYFSGDGARTWQAVPRESTATVGEIPKDSSIEVERTPAGGTRCRNDKINVLLPDSGRSATLAGPPSIKLTWCQPYPDLNGTWWVSGVEPTTLRPSVAASRDRGRTWQVSGLPAFTLPPSQQVTNTSYPMITVMALPTASYAVVLNPGGLTNGLIAIFRSTDQGRTWERTWQAADGKQPVSLTGDPVIGVDGKIRIGQWTSPDGGRTFKPTPDEPIVEHPQWTQAGYLASRPDSARTGTYYLAGDGIIWQPITLPLPKN